MCVVFSPWCDSHCVGVGLYWEKASQRWRESLCLPDPSTPTTPTPSPSSWSNLSEVCVCVCVCVPVRWRQAFLLVFLPAVSLCLITFLCVHRLCTFFPRLLSLCILNLFVCVWVCCARDSFHLWFCARALCVVVVLSLHAVPLFGVCVCCVVCLHKRDRTC